MKRLNRLMSVLTLTTLFVAGVTFAADKSDVHSTSMFRGVKANTGTAMHL